jgi:DNA-binding NarL/FixJ family response regulator
VSAREHRCPGCRHVIAAARTWCTPCQLRAPEELAAAVASARAALDRAEQALTRWLADHPHATARELAVLAAAARGLDTAGIAAEVGASEVSVKETFKQVSARWGCRGRPHLIARAFELGYLAVETHRAPHPPRLRSVS